MRIGVNARVLTKPTPTGVARYTRNLLWAAAARGTAEFRLFGVDGVPESLSRDGRLGDAGAPAPTHSGPRAHVWEQLTLPRSLDADELDVFHTPAGHPPIVASVPLVTTIHDVSPITHPEWFSTAYAALYRVLTPLAVRASDRIVTVSEFAREEIVRTYPRAEGKTVAIPNGVTPRDPADARSVDGLTPGEFLLFVGAHNPRKNLERLLDAYEQYRRCTTDPLALALAGPDNDVFAETGLRDVDGTHALGFVSEPELTWLYHNAAAFVFPSLYEGFGLPILEAMSAGTPVVTSDRGAMAEVAGDAACLVDPTDVSAVATGIDHVLGDEYAEALIEAGRDRADEFTWQRTARKTIEVYQNVATE